MTANVMTNNKTSLWCDGKCLTFLGNQMRYGVWRIMWQGKRGRIIVYADLPPQTTDILEDSKTLELRYYEKGRMDIQSNGKVIFRFKNIQLRRQWVRKPCPLELDSEIISKFSEYYCDIIESPND